MALTRDTDGSQTATLDTEHTLATITTVGFFFLVVDLDAMVNGDITILRIKIPARNAGTVRIIWTRTYSDDQGLNGIVISERIPIIDGNCLFTLEQTDGTGRAYPWSINKEDAIPPSLSTQAKADVNAEMLDVINVDTYAEIGQETPAATQTIRKMIAYPYKAWRNPLDQTDDSYKLYNDAGTVVDQKATISDDDTTYEKGKIVTGP